ncbi:hypothetical protein [Pseudonocardia sp.]|uniref:hypothetical protein n=1 Tax=Pseudonocardia sp. TaxID=60912 RepID=UPI003D13AA76
MSGREDRDRAVVAHSGAARDRVHLVNEGRTACGRRLTFLTVEWGVTGQVTCRACRRRLDGAR